MKTKPKPGDPVLFYGKRLEVAGVDHVGDVERVKVVNADGETARADAFAQIKALRKQQADLVGPEHDHLASQIAELDAQASQGIETFALRADLLSWWDERGVWVSDGRILSDDQVETFRTLTGNRPAPTAQRQALAVIEAMEG